MIIIIVKTVANNKYINQNLRNIIEIVLQRLEPSLNTFKRIFGQLFLTIISQVISVVLQPELIVSKQ